ncbi:MAG TPA: hypothetical protein VEC12_12760 [Bacteroidia bacterium]|nr:hypothetical protein [Bacteroidia bacterium]
MKINFIIIAILCFLQSLGLAAQEHTKEKKVKGQFSVNSNDKLLIENKFGDITINTWDKNEITVDITITTKAKSEEKAQAMLDKIGIEEDTKVKETHKIRYKTKFENTTGNNNGEIDIDYVINMPRKNPVDIKNEFGDVTIGDFDGEMQMAVSYGKFKATKIKGDKKNIKVSFGGVTIDNIESGYLQTSYSDIFITSADNIEIKNTFGDTEISSVKTLKVSQSYGDLKVGTVSTLSGSVEFADMEVKKLSKSADLSLQYCGEADFKDIEAAVTAIKIKAGFSDILLKLNKSSNFSVDITGKFSEVDNTFKALEMTESKGKNDRFKTTYKGKVGKGEGTIHLDLDYGNVDFE